MSWLGSLELLVGAGAVALAVFLVGVFRLAPLPGEAPGRPGAMRLAIAPVIVLLILVVGICLILTGVGLI